MAAGVALDEATARTLAEHYLTDDAVDAVRREGSALLVTAGGDMWRLTSRSAADALIDPQDAAIVEAQRHIFGAPARPHGLALLADGSTHDLGEAEGMQAFLHRLRRSPDPLALARLVIRYRGPSLIGTWPSQLLTTTEELNPALRVADPEVRLGLRVTPEDGGYAVEAATQSHMRVVDGPGELALHRWRITVAPDRQLHVEVTSEATAPAQDATGL